MANPLDTMRLRRLQYGVYAPHTNEFGSVRKGGHQHHQGWDLSASPGTEVKAVGSGKIVFADRNVPGYGAMIVHEFTHNGSTYYALYAHLGEICKSKGSVKTGEIIGKTGYSGYESLYKDHPNEAHLHFGIMKSFNLKKGDLGKHSKAYIDPASIMGGNLEVDNRPSKNLIFGNDEGLIIIGHPPKR